MKDRSETKTKSAPFLTRREFLGVTAAGGMTALAVLAGKGVYKNLKYRTETFIAQANDYAVNFKQIILNGFRELQVSPREIKGKRILLKPNLVETHAGLVHINTHPMVLVGAAEAFLSLGAGRVLIGEGPGHCRDSFLLAEESGVSDILTGTGLQFIDLNYDDVFTAENRNGISRLKNLILPATLKQVDWIVSLAKMKTHHWTGITLSMKNLFGLMPGSYYGWPKNRLHWAGIEQSILDINKGVKPHFAIVDGVIGMQGDGPIMGEPVQSGVIVMGRNLPAVDATCARLMGIDPFKIPYLAAAEGRLGTINGKLIQQRGESIPSLTVTYHLLETIPAQKEIRL